MRFFNTAGPCDPAKHYMLPPETRLPGVRKLIDREQYFVLHAPRQTGKTTSVRSLAQALSSEGRYAALVSTCEAGQAVGGKLEEGISTWRRGQICQKNCARRNPILPFRQRRDSRTS
jgi:hypothetical protein